MIKDENNKKEFKGFNLDETLTTDLNQENTNITNENETSFLSYDLDETLTEDFINENYSNSPSIEDSTKNDNETSFLSYDMDETSPNIIDNNQDGNIDDLIFLDQEFEKTLEETSEIDDSINETCSIDSEALNIKNNSTNINDSFNETLIMDNFKNQDKLDKKTQKDDYKRPKRNNKIIPVIILLGILSGICIFFLLNMKPPKVMIQDFQGLHINELNLWIKENKISEDLIKITNKHDEVVVKDFVISQSEDSEIELKSPIEFVISLGPDYTKEVELIDFNDKTVDEIKDFFEANHFNNVTYKFSPSIDIVKNNFISIDIKETTVARNTKITIEVSSGFTEVTIPDFTNKSLDSVLAWGDENLINIKVTTKYSNSIEKDHIINFSPVKDTKIYAGDTIEVVVSEGKLLVTENYIGKNEQDVKNSLALTPLKEIYVYIYSDQKEGIVIDQNPKAGVEVLPTDSITITISKGKIELTNYIGNNYSTFKTYIDKLNTDKAGLTITLVEDTSSITTLGKITKIEILKDNIVVNNASSEILSISPNQEIKYYVKTAKITNNSNKSETEFNKLLTNLGLAKGNVTKSYHDTIVSNNIISNDTGTFYTQTAINYQLSLGKYQIPDLTNKSRSEIDTLINEANKLNAGITINWSTKDSDTEKPISCEISGKIINCVEYNYKPIINLDDSLVGKLVNEFISEITSKNLLLGTKTEEYSETIAAGIIITYTTGTFGLNDKIDYTVSLGPYPEASLPNLNSFCNGINSTACKVHIEDKLKNFGFTNFNITIVDSVEPDGTVIDSTPAGLYKLNHQITAQISNGQKA